MAKIYKGKRAPDGVVVEVLTFRVRKGRRLLRHIPYHSPDGFEWGYGGSGPADLALALLVDHFQERPPAKGWQDPRHFDHWTVKSRAWKYHQPFKWEFVAGFADTWDLYDTQIEKWLKRKEKEE